MLTCMLDQLKKGPRTKPYAENLLETQEDTHNFARKHLELASDRIKSYYDSKCSQQIKVEEAVGLQNPQRKKGVSPKLQDPGKALMLHKVHK